jgi:hypothetical protein
MRSCHNLRRRTSGVLGVLMHADCTKPASQFGGALDEEQDRYTTGDEAEAGHAAMVRRVRDAKGC